MSEVYKVYVDVGEPEWHTNGLTFGTEEEARNYATDLYGRWTMVKRTAVVEIHESHREAPPTHPLALSTAGKVLHFYPAYD